MSLINLIIRYFLWHYTKAFVDFFVIWRDIFWSCIHFFSIPTMLKTLFSPWKRIIEEGRGIGNFLSSLIVNIIMRAIGAIMRSGLIIIGVLALLMVFLLGLALLALWIFTPFIIIFIFIKGVALLF